MLGFFLFSRGDPRISNRVEEDDGLKKKETIQKVLISRLIRRICRLTHKTSRLYSRMADTEAETEMKHYTVVDYIVYKLTNDRD